MSTGPPDKYGFKTLAVGQSKEVRAATKTAASTMLYRYRERVSRFVYRRFRIEVEPKINGLIITRLPDSEKAHQPWDRNDGDQ
jgi:hypothetical protein